MITEKQAFKIAYELGVITAYELLEYRKNSSSQFSMVHPLEYVIPGKLSLVQGGKRLETRKLDSQQKLRPRASRACHGHGIRLIKANGKGD